DDRGHLGSVALSGRAQQSLKIMVFGCLRLEGGRHGDPALVAMLARQGVLDVAQGRRGIGGAARLQAALRLFLEIVEGAHGHLLSCTPGVRLGQAERRFEHEARTGWVGADSLAADRRRPRARCPSSYYALARFSRSIAVRSDRRRWRKSAHRSPRFSTRAGRFFTVRVLGPTSPVIISSQVQGADTGAPFLGRTA